ncbi:tetratricopeptide repeat-containing glycosyltransferase [Lolliginicoccus levis]|uniref:tetratricopeptide repeat-containing glycosyltransferase n=1 Tax=Lolliginicoccus levis TaxID=2919542 RepID=UPI00241E0571|nr:glycosyltransferase [Lolliginicoccus levis]
MIVKDEAKVIERCLASVKPLIDFWVISDTGSADGTQGIIREFLADIPGELHEDEWVDFGHNRSLNLRHARGKADFLLLIDADIVVRIEGPLPELRADSFMVQHAGELLYRNRRLVRGDIDWRYVGATHEYITADRAVSSANLDAWVVEHFADGGSRADKFERDARLLQQDIDRDPGNARAVFYLAQTMRDMGNTQRAIELYSRRASMGGWAEEVCYSLLQVGVLESDRGNWGAGMDALTRAWEARPQRLEACYELASRLRAKGNHQAAHAFAVAGLGRPIPDDVLFMSPWIYRWGLLFEFSITSYWVGDRAASLRACDELLAMDDLPARFRDQTLRNREFSAPQAAPPADVPTPRSSVLRARME